MESQFLRPSISAVKMVELCQSLADITVICQDDSLQWNTAVLAACSPLLRTIVEDTTESVILLPDFSTTQVIQVFSLLCGILPSVNLEDCDESLQDLCSLLLVPMELKDDTNSKNRSVEKWKMEIEDIFSEEETTLKEEVTSDNDCGDNTLTDSEMKVNSPKNETGEKNMLEESRLKKTKKFTRRKKKVDRDKDDRQEPTASVCWEKDSSPERQEDFFMSAESVVNGPPFCCFQCSYMSPSRRNLKLHFTRRHLKEKLFKCVDCGKRYVSANDVKAHWRRAHAAAESLEHICDECGKGFSIPSMLKAHKKCHESEKKYRCKFCEKIFLNTYQRDTHEERHTAESVACGVCGKTFVSAKAAEEHEDRIHSENYKYVECNICNKKLRSGSMRSHYSRVHQHLKQKFNCQLCKESFLSVGKLNEHRSVEHGVTSEFPCPYCDRVLVSKYKFKIHSARKHGGKKLPVELHRNHCALEKYTKS